MKFSTITGCLTDEDAHPAKRHVWGASAVKESVEEMDLRLFALGGSGMDASANHGFTGTSGTNALKRTVAKAGHGILTIMNISFPSGV
ncbi:hypothetical protein V5799_013803 [Amblyomma americanum]|uniref:Uncharacterized protein n=1 Tax=Amblyomma americanum TaxID=6943 RepID=A0AAQ4E4U9_AMBAM